MKIPDIFNTQRILTLDKYGFRSKGFGYIGNKPAPTPIFDYDYDTESYTAFIGYDVEGVEPHIDGVELYKAGNNWVAENMEYGVEYEVVTSGDGYDTGTTIMYIESILPLLYSAEKGGIGEMGIGTLAVYTQNADYVNIYDEDDNQLASVPIQFDLNLVSYSSEWGLQGSHTYTVRAENAYGESVNAIDVTDVTMIAADPEVSYTDKGDDGYTIEFDGVEGYQYVSRETGTQYVIPYALTKTGNHYVSENMPKGHEIGLMSSFTGAYPSVQSVKYNNTNV